MAKTAEDCENAVLDVVAGLRGRMVRALDETSGNNQFPALGARAIADQWRVIVSTSFVPQSWTVREGKQCIDHSNQDARVLLRTLVGKGRNLVLSNLFTVLEDIAEPRDQRMPEFVLAAFVNLLVAQPIVRPSDELRIWVAIASLASPYLPWHEVNVFDSISCLHDDYDILHKELPPCEDTPALSPGSAAAPNESAAAHEARLLIKVFPDLAPQIAAAATDDEKHAIFFENERRLRSYVRQRVFEPISRELVKSPSKRWAAADDEMA